MITCDVLVLAGGRGSRLGGTDKAALQLGGQRLVDRVVQAARSVTSGQVIVIGPQHAGSQADAVLREEPQFGGPLAGIAAGLQAVDAVWLMVLSCDLEYPQPICDALHQAMQSPGTDGVVLVDDHDRTQWLAGCYRTAVLRDRCAALGPEVANAAARRVLGTLDLARIQVSAELCADIDTHEALERARQRLPGASQITADSAGPPATPGE